jgi:hypothetical protein
MASFEMSLGEVRSVTATPREASDWVTLLAYPEGFPALLTDHSWSIVNGPEVATTLGIGASVTLTAVATGSASLRLTGVDEVGGAHAFDWPVSVRPPIWYHFTATAATNSTIVVRERAPWDTLPEEISEKTRALLLGDRRPGLDPEGHSPTFDRYVKARENPPISVRPTDAGGEFTLTARAFDSRMSTAGHDALLTRIYWTRTRGGSVAFQDDDGSGGVADTLSVVLDIVSVGDATLNVRALDSEGREVSTDVLVRILGPVTATLA